ncbi:ABC transporter permease subunit [Rubrobacter tropicus]|uniref:ABC transporter permease subunit n=1 Tax=Rubrobacter tropicus TaxID=2653851 RepID=A0A6G8QA38_9ACTN|nr:carbohydrate ABC transporter permease [Rubrobacter tropicus]QIN83288.1 ABC transporter permease subunit [Rubrobacter tropicus]
MTETPQQKVNPAAVRRGRSAKSSLGVAIANVAYYALMIVLAVVFLLPLIWMFVSSLKPESEVLVIPPSFFPTEIRWQNYVDVFGIIPVFFYNSAKLAFLNVVGILLTSSLAGYAFARLEFAGRDLVFTLLLATAIIPSIVYLIPQYIVFRELGWIDTHLPLWVPRVLTPVFATFLMRQYFKTMPKDLEDAARIDGASTFAIYWRIMLPQTKPALAAIGVFTFLESWNDLFGPLIFLNSQDLQTLPVALAQFQGEYFTQVSLLMAAATVSVIPVLIVYLFAQKYFVQGITMTGLKG